MKKLIKKHSKVLLAGFLHALKSTLAVATLAAAIALLICVPISRGYLAVGQFVSALLLIVAAGVLFYNCGADIAKGRFSK